jgi:hypothetical protein
VQVCELDTGAHHTQYSLCFADEGSSLVVEGPGEGLSAWNSDSGASIPVTDAHRAAFDRSKNYVGHSWAWKGTGPVRDLGEEAGFQQQMAELLSLPTGRPVAWLPMLLGGVDYHPDRPIWLNKRSDQVWLFTLERAERAPTEG